MWLRSIVLKIKQSFMLGNIALFTGSGCVNRYVSVAKAVYSFIFKVDFVLRLFLHICMLPGKVSFNMFNVLKLNFDAIQF